MVSKFEEFADTLVSLPDVKSIWKQMAKFSYDRGFSACSLTLASHSTDGIESKLLISDLSEEFCTIYRDSGLVALDPFLLFNCHTFTAKTVATEDLSGFPGASQRSQAFLDFTADSGAKNGLGIPVCTFDNETFGGWLFTSLEGRDLFDLMQKEHSTETHLASVLAHERMVAVGLGSLDQDFILSKRERECLLWLCAGMRVSQIANKLSVSNSAINLYISNAKQKLGAKTREQAVARAIFSGEIVL